MTCIFGFHQDRSCGTQLISLLYDLTINYDRSLQTTLTITYFAKAFNVVLHHRLFYKLNWYGTVLDPASFLVYINGLPDSICHSTLRLFTDDCLLYKAIQSPHDAINLQ